MAPIPGKWAVRLVLLELVNFHATKILQPKTKHKQKLGNVLLNKKIKHIYYTCIVTISLLIRISLHQ